MSITEGDEPGTHQIRADDIPDAPTVFLFRGNLAAALRFFRQYSPRTVVVFVPGDKRQFTIGDGCGQGEANFWSLLEAISSDQRERAQFLMRLN